MSDEPETPDEDDVEELPVDEVLEIVSRAFSA